MAATAQSTTYWHPTPICTRRGPLSLLKSAKVFKGAVACTHNGRLMPAGDFDNATVLADGGPLPVPGADANGGFRVIALRRNVRFVLLAGAGGSTTLISVVYGATVDVTVTADPAAATAKSVANLLWNSAQAMRLIKVNYTGTGAGLVAAFAAAAAPCVQILGISQADIINDVLPAADKTLLDQPQFEFGRVFLNNDSGSPVSVLDVSSDVRLLDDITISRQFSPMTFNFQLAEFTAERGPAILIP